MLRFVHTKNTMFWAPYNIPKATSSVFFFFFFAFGLPFRFVLFVISFNPLDGFQSAWTTYVGYEPQWCMFKVLNTSIYLATRSFSWDLGSHQLISLDFGVEISQGDAMFEKNEASNIGQKKKKNAMTNWLYISSLRKGTSRGRIIWLKYDDGTSNFKYLTLNIILL